MIKNICRLLTLVLSCTLISCAASKYPLTIHTQPAGAQLTQNGHLLGQSPVTIDYPKYDLKQGRMNLKVDVQWPSGVVKKQAIINIIPDQKSTQVTIQRPNLPGRAVDEDYGKIYLSQRQQSLGRKSSLVVMTSQRPDFMINCNKVSESPSRQGINCTYSCLGEMVSKTIPNLMTCPATIQSTP